MNVDPNDPATWPEDIAGLAALAHQASTEHPQAGMVETEGALAPAVPDSPVATGDGSLAGGAEAADRPAGVQARDGTHVLPYERFEEVQRRAQGAEARVAELERRLGALEAQGGAPEGAAAGTDVGTQSAPAGTIEARIEQAQAYLAQVEADGDEELAALARQSVETLQELRSMREPLAQIQAWLGQQQEAQAAQGRAAVDEAVAANPVMSAWMRSPDPLWAERAEQVERQLLAVPGSRVATAQTWGERFAAVVEAVHATYGLSPEAVHLAGQGRDRRGQQGGGAFGAMPDAGALPPPPSLGAMGGEAISGAGQDLASLERMTGAELLAHTRRLDARQLASLVARVA